MTLRTWHKEGAIVWGVLVTVLVASGRWADWREWLAAVGVGLGFHHASVADRLREAEEERHLRNNAEREEHGHRVECVRWLNAYWIGKEVAWVGYFLSTGAVSALVGCAVFIAHPFWRRWYRAKYPRLRVLHVLSTQEPR